MNDKPLPPLKLVDATLDKQNKSAVYFTLVFEDAAGRRWTTWGGKFYDDLKPVGASCQPTECPASTPNQS